MNTVLLCTVGGAHQPILRAIESVAPEYVCFFCTERDARTGQIGSDVQVVGEGKVIKAEPQAEKPTLPNIPTQAQLRKSRFECRVVPADSLDGAVAAMRTAVAELLGKWPGSRLIADYTGGTKTMTAALVLTAFEFNEVELQLVAGARPNLLRTADETEQTRVASVGALRLRKTLVDCLDAWTRFSYDEAAEGLAAIRAPIDTPGAETLPFATAMSKALAHWDRFDHASALRLIEPFGSRVMALYPKLLPNVKLLTKDGRGREPARRSQPLRLPQDALPKRRMQPRFRDDVHLAMEQILHIHQHPAKGKTRGARSKSHQQVHVARFVAVVACHRAEEADVAQAVVFGQREDCGAMGLDEWVHALRSLLRTRRRSTWQRVRPCQGGCPTIHCLATVREYPRTPRA